MTDYTRRDVKQLTPEVLHKYRTLVENNDLAAFEALLDSYSVDQDLRGPLVEEFKRYAVRYLRRRWTSR